MSSQSPQFTARFSIQESPAPSEIESKMDLQVRVNSGMENLSLHQPPSDGPIFDAMLGG